MESEGDREFLLGIFLMEAWDTAGALEERLGQLADPAVSVDDLVPPLLVLAHRLKGSAALHGFPRLSELAARAESLLEALPRAAPDERAGAAAFLSGIVTVFKDVFDAISASGVEDADRIAELSARELPGRSAATTPVDALAPAASRDVEVPTPAARGARMVEELDRFFADGGDIVTYFAPEAAEHLDAMTASLLELPREGPSEAHLATVFRAVHTLKGAAYTVGCVPIGDVSHELEDLLVAVRERRLALTPAVVETALAGADAMKLVFQSAGAAPAALGETLDRVIEQIRSLTSAAADAATPLVEAATPPTAQFAEGLAPAAAIVRASDTESRKLRHRATVGAPGSIRVNVDRLDSLMNLVGELMIARSRLDRRLAELDRIGELMLFSRARMARVVRDFEGKHEFTQVPTPSSVDDSGPQNRRDMASVTELFAELEFDRYDDFNILARRLSEVSADVGEVQAQHAALIRAIREDMAQIQRLTVALRKDVTRSRMVPIGRLFPRFIRQGREAARAAGKTVTFEVHGESVEVDTSMVEQMSDSLLHLAQNAIGHGIEPEDERLRAGKPAPGTVSLRAYQQGAFIIVEVEDDGRGMDPDKLRRQAVERGLLRPDAAQALSTPEALNLIFVPGFSTAAEVTRASGRGVGMDVVRTNVTRLNGEIDVETEVGARTRFTIKLPLTVAITDALMVRAGTEMFALPLTTVGTMRLLSPDAIEQNGDREVVRIDHEPIDLIRLDRVLGVEGAEPAKLCPVVVLRAGGKPFALAVNDLCGKEEIVVKSLGDFLEGVGPFSGATISGDGRVILLLDPLRLFELGREIAFARLEERGVGGDTPAFDADRPRRLLLVDDSLSVRKFVGQMLEKAGFHVVTAVDGQDALERLTAISVDLVVTDLEMPRVNGYALIEDLRRRAGTRALPIVVLTTRAGDKHQSLARRLGIRHYVTKPVDEQAFIALIESILSPATRELSVGG
jgi:chemosensory pili system protein ChpA (sensor histidine kinase/response regulator)